MEIVTDSSLRSADESYAYLTQIRQIVRYLGASSGDMEKGAMRCEANISIRPVGSRELGTKVEIKNLNSFRAVRSAIAYEAERQQHIIESGGHVRQETMGWDERANITRPQRSKETSDDYRYFPEPDLLVADLDDEWIARVHASLPELPAAKAERFASAYELNSQEIAALIEDHAVAAYFEEAAQVQGADPKQVGNWITGEIFRRLNAEGRSIEDVEVQPAALIELLSLVKRARSTKRSSRSLWPTVGTGRLARRDCRCARPRANLRQRGTRPSGSRGDRRTSRRRRKNQGRQPQHRAISDGSSNAGDAGEGQPAARARIVAPAARDLTSQHLLPHSASQLLGVLQREVANFLQRQGRYLLREWVFQIAGIDNPQVLKP